MASSSSSATPSEHHHPHQDHHPGAGTGGGIPAPPPPTPSNHNLSLTSAPADAALSRLLCRLTSPALSLPPLPSRLSSAGPAKLRHAPTPPVISLAHPQEALLKSAASELGFFHIADHGVPSHLPATAQLECRSLFRAHPTDLSPLGFDFDAVGGGDDDGEDPSFLVFDMAAAAGDQALPRALWEYARHLEKVGMEVVELLCRAGGFRNPFEAKASTATPRTLLWISSTANGREEHADGGGGVGDSDGRGDDGVGGPPPWGRCYPYAVCLQYEMRSWSICLLLGDDQAGWTTLAPHPDSILVAIGDIAQVWSDGGFKKVRGRPAPAVHDGDGSSSCVTISVLVTLSTDSVVSPLPPGGEGGAFEEEEGSSGAKFSAFAFEQYAWRLFHEQFPLTDPLRRYRL